MSWLCADFITNRWNPRPKAGPATAGGPTAARGPLLGEVGIFLRWVERNLTALTWKISMAEIGDLPPSV
jgi:hypothetical protein